MKAIAEHIAKMTNIGLPFSNKRRLLVRNIVTIKNPVLGKNAAKKKIKTENPSTERNGIGILSRQITTLTS